MRKIDPEKLRDVDVYFAAPSEQIRTGFRFTMHSYGIHHERIFARIEELTNAIKASAPDLLIVDADMGPSAFDLVNDIRHFKLGRNPFILIGMMVDAQTEGGSKACHSCRGR